MIPLAGFLLAHAAYLLVLALAAAWIGRGFVPRLRFDSWLEEAAVALGLGLGVLAHLVLLLGLLGRLSRGPLLLGIGLLLAVAAPGSLRRLREMTAWRPARAGTAAFAVIAVIAAGVLVFLALPYLALPLYPPTDWDATAYHLAQAQIFVAEQRVVPTPYLRFAVFPQLNEMLFALGLALLDEAAAQQAELVVLAALLLAVAAWGRRHLSPRAGLWAAALVLGHPLISWLGTTAYVDLGLTLFTTLAAACLWNWGAEGRRSWLVLAGVFLGFALGTKYLGLFAAGLLGIATLGAAARRRDGLAPFLLAGVAAAVAAPWYARNAWTTGNPLFPFHPEVFGDSLWWSTADVQSALLSLRVGYGIGRSPEALLRLPWALIDTPGKFTEVAGPSLVLLALVPVAAAVAVRDRRLRGFLALGLGFFLLWFWNSQVLRFLMPAVPPLALAAAGALDRLAGRMADGLAGRSAGLGLAGRPWRRWGQAAAVGLALLLVWPSWRAAGGRVRARGALPVTAAARDAYLAKFLPTYPAYRLLNARHGRRYTVYALHDGNMAYFAQGTFQGDWFGPGRYSDLIPHAGDPAALHRELRELGADYLLVPAAQSEVLGGVAPPAFQPVAAGPWGELHALAGGAGARRPLTPGG